MPALAQYMEQRAACRLAIPRSLAPPVAAVRRAGGPAAALGPRSTAARRTALVPLAGRYTGRSTDQRQPPPDPNRRLRARRQPAERRSAAGPESASEFSAEVCVRCMVSLQFDRLQLLKYGLLLISTSQVARAHVKQLATITCSSRRGSSILPLLHPLVQLFVLFGLPALVLILSYAFNDPKALMISLPLLMLIPGIR